MKEPSVIIQMVVDQQFSNVVNNQNIAGGVVIASCGTLEPKLFNSSTEVLKEFTKSGLITRQTDTTLIHAAAIADVMPVLLKRSFSDDGTRAGFGIYRNKVANNTSNTLSLAEVNKGSVVEGKFYDIENASEEVIGQVAFSNNGYGITSSAGGTTALQFSAFSENNWNKVVAYFTGNDSNFDYAFITEEDGEEVYISRNDIVIDDVSKSITINTNEHSSAEMITLVFSTATTLVRVEMDYVDYIVYQKLFVKKGTPLKYKQSLTLARDYVFNPMNFCFAINDKAYYNEAQAAPEIASKFSLVSLEGIDRRSTLRDVFDAISKSLGDGYIDYDGNSINVYSEVAYASITSETGVNNETGDSVSIVSPSGGDFSILIYANSPANGNFTAQIAPNTGNEELIDVTVVTPSRTYEYTGSTDPEYVNDYGANQYIQNIDDYEGIPFTIKIIPEESGDYPVAKDILSTPTISFGSMNISDGKNVSTRKAALEELTDQDMYKIAFLCPFGYPNNAYLTKLITYNPKIWSFTPIGLFCEKDDPEAIIAQKPAISTEYAILMAPHDKSTSMTDWVVDMSLEVAYLTKVMSNAAKYWEFAPMMGKDNATLQVTKPSVIFKKSTREKLLDARIMSLITKKSENLSYLNKNKCSGGDTVISEEQNIRLACKINRDLDTLLEPVIGKYNTEETRSKVINLISDYFSNNITNQVYSIDSYSIICDESNNPPSVRANNQLVIDLSVVYLNAVYEVKVYHRALNVASNQ